ncbi:NADPH:quinone reductase-like Zn-dependent oxidoreductase [Glycomyces algeriensis]|uniref:NADPH:quinone reductase n=2 Tax=Glycomyces algeriensis TaxID=256037 RepID=A0A9W6LIV9_9ACTN|nr:NADPH:quinone reductase-like Zn-dependent oxidoreductase [Glycomyces algeriensis]GLI44998.1 NADPH:quinone reductase [Glycomyces algeriensis]
MPEMMRAVTQTRLGGPEVLALQEVERPEPYYGEIQVRVHAAGVNPVDPAAREIGLYIGQPPFILGWDVSGVVEKTGIGVTRFKPGDEVFGMPRFPHQAGTHAEYVTAPSRQFARKPDLLSHTEAAGLPLCGLTAWQALVDNAGLAAGQSVLIHAAAGGIGHLAVQIAKARGAHVIATASAGKHDFVRALGADEVIDYRAVDFTEVVADVDVALTTLAGDYAARSVSVIRDGGVLAQLYYSLRDAEFPEAVARGIRTDFMLVEPDQIGLEALARLAADGLLKVHVSQTFPLEDFAKAHEAMESGGAIGKIVLTVD